MSTGQQTHWDGQQWLVWDGAAWVPAQQAAESRLHDTELRHSQWTTAVQELQAQHARLEAEVAQLRTRVSDLTDEAALQEVGIYRYTHPLETAAEYQDNLKTLREQMKTAFRDGHGVSATTNWTVNGKVTEGRRMVKDFSQLMFRAYNAEADNLVRTLKPYRLSAATDRLTNTKMLIARLGKTMDITITDYYHSLRIYELQLVSDYLAKKEEEKEAARAERERQREEEKARREFEAEKARLAKERAHYLAVSEKLVANGDTEGAAEWHAKLEEIDAAIAEVTSREANIRAGYVYVISNIGSFGGDVVKVGMTRRLTPMDRINELGDASVPFKFDVHALIFSHDAVGLESELHRRLEASRLNKVNLRREFFRTTPHVVRQAIESIDGTKLLEFSELPEALEWRASTA